MNAKVPFAAACAAILLLLTPTAPEAERPPVWGLNPPNEHSIGDSDPWLPDTHEPSLTLRDPNRTSVEAGAERPAAVRPRWTWVRSLMTLLRLFHFGGIVR